MPQGVVKWGIIGCGKIAHKFAQDLDLVDGGQLVAVASRSSERAADFAQKHRAGQSFASYEQMLQSSDIDAVYIATPHAFHAQHTLLALDYKKHVLCEKPMGVNEGQVTAMIARANEQGCLLMEALWTDFLPAIVHARAALSSGQIGDILHLRADFGFKANLDPALRLLNPNLAGGALLDIGIYPAYLLLSLLGPPDQLAAQATMHATGVDLHTQVIAKYAAGQHAYLESTFRVTTECIAEIYGTEGSLIIHRRWHEADAYTLRRGDESKTLHLPKKGFGYYHEILAFQQAVLSQSTVAPFSHERSLALSRLLDQIREEIGLEYPMID